MRHLAAALFLFLFSLSSSLAGQGVSENGVDLIAGRAAGPWRRLFLDATVVEQQRHVRRVFHAVQKHPANPLLTKDHPWEGRGPYLYGTVMWDGGKLRMWYHHPNPTGMWNSYAESTDGLAWTKPALGLIDYQGSKQNNLFATRSLNPVPKPPKDFGQCHNPSVIHQPWHPDPEKRYALYCFSYEYYKPRVAFSLDGLKWKFVPMADGKGLFASGDVVNFFHDPYQGRYVATWKTATSRGRAVGVATSPDGLEWTKPQNGAVMYADDLDPDETQLYGMPVFPYQGYYLGLPWIYHARWPKDRQSSNANLSAAEKKSPCTMDVQFAWSRDLTRWNRTPERGVFIPRGEADAFDSGMVYSARAPVVVDDKLYFYYGGFNGPHKVQPKPPQAAIGVGVLRIDGFCSMQAGDQEGSLITRPEMLESPRVTINAKTSPQGHVVAEILDADWNVLEGFSKADCIPFEGDNVRHVMRWKSKSFTPEQMSVEKHLRFYIKDADLYSYISTDAAEPATVIYDPSTGMLPSDPRNRLSQQFQMRGDAAGFRIAEEGSLAYLDMHSVRGEKTHACFGKTANWNDATDWRVEMWSRIADQGTEPVYGFATFIQPPSGRNVSLYLSDKAVGLMTTQGGEHIVLKSVPLDTTDRFRWYSVSHTGGRTGTITLAVDGKETIRLPFADFHQRGKTQANVVFGPNASDQEGRMHVAKFAYRFGNAKQLLGPIDQSKDAAPTGESEE